jgi:hypothetical protein
MQHSPSMHKKFCVFFHIASVVRVSTRGRAAGGADGICRERSGRVVRLDFSAPTTAPGEIG